MLTVYDAKVSADKFREWKLTNPERWAMVQARERLNKLALRHIRARQAKENYAQSTSQAPGRQEGAE